MLSALSSWLALFFFGETGNTSAKLSPVDHPYLNQEAVVTQAIPPGESGRVYCRGSLWPAQCVQTINLPPGTRVRVAGRVNITLLVEPVRPLLPAAS
jgi:membrane protein implicated in regulation of membrane protease activity